jgi:nicotinate-nucleotide adenylyltransferase
MSEKLASNTHHPSPDTRRWRIGIMGGTFDPIHTGHLIIAQEAGWQLKLDKVLFIPAGDPPHKQTQKVTPAYHRLEMVKQAIGRVPLFEASTLEIERGGLSYTVDTLTTLGEIYPSADLYFILGADAIAELGNWHKPERILELAYLALAERHGYSISLDPLTPKFPTLTEKVVRLETPMIEIASHEIRQRVANGAPISYLVPYRVEIYIKEQKLYR